MRIHQSSFPKLAAALLIFVLALIVYLVADGLNRKNLDATSGVYAKQGRLDVSFLDLSQQAAVPLLGDWAFDWRVLVPPSSELANTDQVYVNVPHEWYAKKVDPHSHSQYGFATYRVRIETGKTYPQLALTVPNIGSAYKLFIDDTLIAEGGVVSESVKGAKAGYLPGIFTFEPNSSSIMLTLQVSNYDLLWGGLWSEIRFGTPETIYTETMQALIQSAILVCFFMTVALFNIIQYLLRTIDPSPIIIASICILIGLREIEVSNILYFVSIAQLSFDSVVKFNFLTFMGATPIIISYFHINFRDFYHSFIINTVYVLSIALVLIVVLTPPSFFSVMMPFYQWFVILLSLYVMWGLIRALLAKKANAKIISLGTLILFLLIINDILSNLKILDTPNMISFGLAAFIMCQTYITYLRFVNESTEKLLLEELAAKDPLTGLPNRRGIRAFMKSAMHDFQHKQTPFCLMLIDFDHFKEINDSLGHDMGDKVLIEGARVMQDTVRERDVVARWGGEEFLLLTPQSSLSGALKVAEKIKESVNAALSKTTGVEITLTVGVAQIAPGESIDECIKRADLALYDGKRTGRNKVMIALDE
jgi:diguanylate cyclase (GGDEF)-like protein